ncbi:MAG: phytoene desaturase family protein [Candidatus Humimicrobiaceae bacterium]
MVYRSSKKYDVIIIGAGIGGLTCGALLAKNGFKTLVIEQHSIPGGYCTSFKRNGFVFDAAVHFSEGLGEGGRFYQILKELKVEKEIELHKIDPLYRVFFGDESFSVSADLNEYISILSKKFPKEGKGISELFETIKRLKKETEKLPTPLRIWNKIFVPLKFPLIFKYYKKTFAEMTADYIEDVRLKAIICAGWPYVGLPPSKISAIQMAGYLYSAHFEGHYYPKGGTQVLVSTLAKALKKYGGELQLSTKVTKVLVENNKAVGVETAKGNKINAKYVVSNADARQTFLKLIEPGKLNSKFLNCLNQMEPSISFFQVWLGVDMNLRDKGVTESEIFCYPSYDLDYVYDSCMQGKFESGCGIAIPTSSDPGLAPENKHIVSLIYPIPYDYKERWRTENGKRGDSYRKLKDEIKRQLIKTAERVIPKLSEHIILSEAATPLTLERYTQNSKGAAYGWASIPDQSGTSRLQPETPIKNLYLAGHWTTSGGGTITVAISGKNTAEMIIKVHSKSSP